MRTVMAGVLLSVWGLAANKEQLENTRRLEQAANMFSEIMATPGKAIPGNLLESAYCLVVVPSLKQGASIIGAKYGVGYISCREGGRGGWSAPGAVRIEGGSFGFQIGGSETGFGHARQEQRRSREAFVRGVRFRWAGRIVGAGPIGRSARRSAKRGTRISLRNLSPTVEQVKAYGRLRS